MTHDGAPPELLTFDPRKVDSEYVPFPSFAEWRGKVVDATRWKRYTARLKARSNDPVVAKRAFEVVKRAAAIDTGAIEGLYEVDSGFTFSVAMQAVNWKIAVEGKGVNVSALFEAQLAGYDNVVDLATQGVPLAEATIRGLHSTICAAQKTYWVQTEVGPQQHELPLGVYKHHPNHVIDAEGKTHAYAPVDLTPSEMYRLTKELSSPEFLESHPVVQAAYAHYAFVVIHPFADGNGRVSRALASVFTCRATSMPLLILAQSRPEYLAALRQADASEHQAFVDFVMDRCVEGMEWATQAMKAAEHPDPARSVAKLEELYVTRGGYTHAEVDAAAAVLTRLAKQEFERQIEPLKTKNVGIGIGQASGLPPIPGGFRAPQAPALLTVSALSGPPADAAVRISYGVVVPKDCGLEDELLLQPNSGTLDFGARMPELKTTSTAMAMRLRMFVESVLGALLAQLQTEAAKKLRGKGL